MHAGEVIYLMSGVEAIRGKSITLRYRLFKADTQKPAFEILFRCVLLDLETRRAREIPDDVGQAAQQFLSTDAPGRSGS